MITNTYKTAFKVQSVLYSTKTFDIKIKWRASDLSIWHNRTDFSSSAQQLEAGPGTEEVCAWLLLCCSQINCGECECVRGEAKKTK